MVYVRSTPVVGRVSVHNRIRIKGGVKDRNDITPGRAGPIRRSARPINTNRVGSTVVLGRVLG